MSTNEVTKLPVRHTVVEIERRLIGALLALGPASEVLEVLALTGDEFTTEIFGKVWKAGQRQSEAGVKVTVDTISMAGLRRKALTEADVATLEALAYGNTLTLESFRRVAHEFRLHAQGVRVAAQFERMAHEIRGGAFDPSVIAGHVSAIELELRRTGAQVTDLTGDLMGLLDTWDRNNTDGRASFVPTGIKVLDAEIGGLPRALSLFAADAGVGKTALIDSMIHAQLVSDPAFKVGLISPEDGVLHVVKRWLARETGWVLRDIGGKARTLEDHERLQTIAKAMHDELLPRIFGYRERSITGDQLIQLCWHMVEKGAHEVVIDNFNKITLRDGSQDYHERVQRFSDRLSQFAEKAQVPVVLVVHLADAETNQKAGGKVTGSGGLQGGKALGRDARFRLDLYRKDRELRGVIAKANEIGEQGAHVQFARQATAGLVDPDSGEKIDLRAEAAAERKQREDRREAEQRDRVMKRKAAAAASKAEPAAAAAAPVAPQASLPGVT